MIIKVFAFIICTLLLSVILKSVKSDFSMITSLLGSIIVLSLAIITLSPTITFILSLSERVSFNDQYMEIIFKSVVISLLGGLTSEMCKENGQNVLAQSTDIICKCTLLSLTLPIYIDVFNLILKLWKKS